MVKSSDDKPTSNGNNGYRFKGIRKRKWGKWVSEVRIPNSRERIWLGSYDTPEKAARAFDAAVFCLRGPNAKFNFPENPPAIAAAASLSPAEIQEVAAKYATEGDVTAPVTAIAKSPEQEQSMLEFMEFLSTDSGENKTDFGNPHNYCDQFVPGNYDPTVDFNEELEFPQESFLWSFWK